MLSRTSHGTGCFGRPCLADGGPIPGYPILTGWSLGGLSDRDRARCAAFVRQYPATGDTGTDYRPTRASLEDASGLLSYDHPQLWSAADLVKRAAWAHETNYCERCDKHACKTHGRAA